MAMMAALLHLLQSIGRLVDVLVSLVERLSVAPEVSQLEMILRGIGEGAVALWQSVCIFFTGLF